MLDQFIVSEIQFIDVVEEPREPLFLAEIRPQVVANLVLEFFIDLQLLLPYAEALDVVEYFRTNLDQLVGAVEPLRLQIVSDFVDGPFDLGNSSEGFLGHLAPFEKLGPLSSACLRTRLLH